MTNDPVTEWKRQAAEYALGEIRNGMRVGLGSGSTARFVIEGLGRRVAEGLRIVGVPSSEATAVLAREHGIPLEQLTAEGVDVAIDGTDEVDAEGRLIKGHGGALLREKLVAQAARRFIVVADESKRVVQLGSKVAVPVEIVRWGWERTAAQLMAYQPTLRRTASGEPFLTDNGNWVLNCAVGLINDAVKLHESLKGITGVVETGLFVGLAHQIILAGSNGVEQIDLHLAEE